MRFSQACEASEIWNRWRGGSNQSINGSRAASGKQASKRDVPLLQQELRRLDLVRIATERDDTVASALRIIHTNLGTRLAANLLNALTSTTHNAARQAVWQTDLRRHEATFVRSVRELRVHRIVRAA